VKSGFFANHLDEGGAVFYFAAVLDDLYGRGFVPLVVAVARDTG
jgi:hypothetical protein